MTSVRIATILTLTEAVAVARLQPYSLLWGQKADSLASTFLTSAVLLIVNYVGLLFWWAFVYPVTQSPFRHLPRTKWLLVRAAFARYVRTELLFQLSQEIPNDGIIVLGEIVRERLLLTKASTTTELLVHRAYDFTKPRRLRQFMAHFIGTGIVVLEGDKHKALRKSSLQAFSQRQVQRVYPSMWRKALSFVDVLEKDVHLQMDPASNARTGIVEMTNWAFRVTMDIIGISVLGRDFDSLTSPEHPLIQSFKATVGPHLRLYRIMAVWVSFEFVQRLPWKKNEEFNESTAALRSISRKIVADKRKELQDMEHEGHGGSATDILSHLIKAGELSDDELADQILAYIVAGHDTTQSTLLWVCYLLAKHRQWQEVLREEVKERILSFTGEPGEEIGLSEWLETLPYLNGVIHETLRLYPVIPLTGRIAIRDATLGGQAIPKGTEVLVSPWIINRAPESWGETASQFDPTRWISADGRLSRHGNETSNYDLATFLHGPRSCIGVHFAKAELRCLVAAMVSRFEWELGMDDCDVIPGGVLSITPLKGLRLKLKRIEENSSA